MKFKLLDGNGELIETAEALTLDDARESIADRWKRKYRWETVNKSSYWDVKIQDETDRVVYFRLTADTVANTMETLRRHTAIDRIGGNGPRG